MEGMTGCCEPTTQSKKKSVIINDRLHSLLVDVKANHTHIQDINLALFPPEPLGKDANEKSVPAGWFNGVIDMLTTISNITFKTRDELLKLKNEFEVKS